MQAKTGYIQGLKDGETKSAGDLDIESVRLLLSGKSLTLQLQLRLEDGQNVQDLKYRRHGASVEKHESQKSIETFREEAPSIRSVADKPFQRFLTILRG